MSLPILNAVDPTVIPAKTYDRVWVEEIVIRAPDPNGDVVGEVKLHKYGMFDGLAELEPGNGQWIRVENMLQKAASDTDLPQRILELSVALEKIIERHNPDLIAIERVFSQQNLRTVMGTAQISGVAMLLAARRSIPVQMHTPTEVKAAVTGSGRASKQPHRRGYPLELSHSRHCEGGVGSTFGL